MFDNSFLWGPNPAFRDEDEEDGAQPTDTEALLVHVVKLQKQLAAARAEYGEESPEALDALDELTGYCDVSPTFDDMTLLCLRLEQVQEEKRVLAKKCRRLHSHLYQLLGLVRGKKPSERFDVDFAEACNQVIAWREADKA